MNRKRRGKKKGTSPNRLRSNWGPWASREPAADSNHQQYFQSQGNGAPFFPPLLPPSGATDGATSSMATNPHNSTRPENEMEGGPGPEFPDGTAAVPTATTNGMMDSADQTSTRTTETGITAAPAPKKPSALRYIFPSTWLTQAPKSPQNHPATTSTEDTSSQQQSRSMTGNLRSRGARDPDIETRTVETNESGANPTPQEDPSFVTQNGDRKDGAVVDTNDSTTDGEDGSREEKFHDAKEELSSEQPDANKTSFHSAEDSARSEPSEIPKEPTKASSELEGSPPSEDSDQNKMANPEQGPLFGDDPPPPASISFQIESSKAPLDGSVHMQPPPRLRLGVSEAGQNLAGTMPDTSGRKTKTSVGEEDKGIHLSHPNADEGVGRKTPTRVRFNSEEKAVSTPDSLAYSKGGSTVYNGNSFHVSSASEESEGNVDGRHPEPLHQSSFDGRSELDGLDIPLTPSNRKAGSPGPPHNSVETPSKGNSPPVYQSPNSPPPGLSKLDVSPIQEKVSPEFKGFPTNTMDPAADLVGTMQQKSALPRKERNPMEQLEEIPEASSAESLAGVSSKGTSPSGDINAKQDSQTMPTWDDPSQQPKEKATNERGTKENKSASSVEGGKRAIKRSYTECNSTSESNTELGYAAPPTKKARQASNYKGENVAKGGPQRQALETDETQDTAKATAAKVPKPVLLGLGEGDGEAKQQPPPQEDDNSTKQPAQDTSSASLGSSVNQSILCEDLSDKDSHDNHGELSENSFHPSDVLSQAGPAPGLKNFGKSCYMNSSVQYSYGLIAKRSVEVDLVALDEFVPDEEADQRKWNIVKSLVVLLRQMLLDRKVDPTDLAAMRSCIFLHPNFKTEKQNGGISKQQDATEALLALIDSIQALGMGSRMGIKTFALEKLFACSGCGTPNSLEIVEHGALLLQLAKDASVEKMVQSFLENGSEFHTCSRCKKMNNKSQYNFTGGDPLPEVINVFVKRFIGFEKDTTAIDLDSSEYITLIRKGCDGTDVETANYQLAQCMVHQGGESDSGHYMCARREDGLGWNEYDDEKVSSLGSWSAIAKNPDYQQGVVAIAFKKINPTMSQAQQKETSEISNRKKLSIPLDKDTNIQSRNGDGTPKRAEVTLPANKTNLPSETLALPETSATPQKEVATQPTEGIEAASSAVEEEADPLADNSTGLPKTLVCASNPTSTSGSSSRNASAHRVSGQIRRRPAEFETNLSDGPRKKKKTADLFSRPTESSVAKGGPTSTKKPTADATATTPAVDPSSTNMASPCSEKSIPGGEDESSHTDIPFESDGAAEHIDSDNDDDIDNTFCSKSNSGNNSVDLGESTNSENQHGDGKAPPGMGSTGGILASAQSESGQENDATNAPAGRTPTKPQSTSPTSVPGEKGGQDSASPNSQLSVATSKAVGTNQCKPVQPEKKARSESGNRGRPKPQIRKSGFRVVGTYCNPVDGTDPDSQYCLADCVTEVKFFHGLARRLPQRTQGPMDPLERSSYERQKRNQGPYRATRKDLCPDEEATDAKNVKAYATDLGLIMKRHPKNRFNQKHYYLSLAEGAHVFNVKYQTEFKGPEKVHSFFFDAEKRKLLDNTGTIVDNIEKAVSVELGKDIFQSAFQEAVTITVVDAWCFYKEGGISVELERTLVSEKADMSDNQINSERNKKKREAREEKKANNEELTDKEKQQEKAQAEHDRKLQNKKTKESRKTPQAQADRKEKKRKNKEAKKLKRDKLKKEEK